MYLKTPFTFVSASITVKINNYKHIFPMHALCCVSLVHCKRVYTNLYFPLEKFLIGFAFLINMGCYLTITVSLVCQLFHEISTQLSLRKVLVLYYFFSSYFVPWFKLSSFLSSLMCYTFLTQSGLKSKVCDIMIELKHRIIVGLENLRWHSVNGDIVREGKNNLWCILTYRRTWELPCWSL